ncbi:hypothetical protein D3C71_981390 [compost metagenome]
MIKAGVTVVATATGDPGAQIWFGVYAAVRVTLDKGETKAVAVDVQPKEFVPVIVYVVAFTGFADTVSLFVTFNPVAGAHANVVVGLTSDTIN